MKVENVQLKSHTLTPSSTKVSLLWEIYLYSMYPSLGYPWWIQTRCCPWQPGAPGGPGVQCDHDVGHLQINIAFMGADFKARNALSVDCLPHTRSHSGQSPTAIQHTQTYSHSPCHSNIHMCINTHTHTEAPSPHTQVQHKCFPLLLPFGLINQTKCEKIDRQRVALVY